jgi:GNAT superfamily N-acetyltransferase
MQEKQVHLHNVQPEEFLLQNALHQQFVAIFPEYAEIFPAVRDEIQHDGDFGNRFFPHYWLIQKNEISIGLALSRYLLQSNIGFFRFLGVDPAYRRTGVGTLTIQELKKQFCSDARNFGRVEPLGYCFEVENPAVSSDEEIHIIDQQRLDYFNNRGAFVLPVDYFEPVFEVKKKKEAVKPKSMLLMLQPIEADLKSVDLSTTRQLVAAVYYEHYGLDRNDPMALKVLNSIPVLEV